MQNINDLYFFSCLQTSSNLSYPILPQIHLQELRKNIPDYLKSYQRMNSKTSDYLVSSREPHAVLQNKKQL
jgi:hypothetical protein